MRDMASPPPHLHRDLAGALAILSGRSRVAGPGPPCTAGCSAWASASAMADAGSCGVELQRVLRRRVHSRGRRAPRDQHGALASVGDRRRGPLRAAAAEGDARARPPGDGRRPLVRELQPCRSARIVVYVECGALEALRRRVLLSACSDAGRSCCKGELPPIGCGVACSRRWGNMCDATRRRQPPCNGRADST